MTTTTTIDQDYIVNGLRALGNDTDTIAKTLFDLGIRMPANPKQRTHCCPITQYVASHCPSGSTVVSVSTVVCIYPPGADSGYCDEGFGTPPTHVHIRPLPGPVTEFINAFDNGRYPELVV